MFTKAEVKDAIDQELLKIYKGEFENPLDLLRLLDALKDCKEQFSTAELAGYLSIYNDLILVPIGVVKYELVKARKSRIDNQNSEKHEYNLEFVSNFPEIYKNKNIGIKPSKSLHTFEIPVNLPDEILSKITGEKEELFNEKDIAHLTSYFEELKDKEFPHKEVDNKVSDETYYKLVNKIRFYSDVLYPEANFEFDSKLCLLETMYVKEFKELGIERESNYRPSFEEYIKSIDKPDNIIPANIKELENAYVLMLYFKYSGLYDFIFQITNGNKTQIAGIIIRFFPQFREGSLTGIMTAISDYKGKQTSARKDLYTRNNVEKALNALEGNKLNKSDLYKELENIYSDIIQKS